jgi:hypothetical protein
VNLTNHKPYFCGYDELFPFAFILGAGNDIEGALSDIARARVDTALALQHTRPEIILIATGGFGFFNATSVPHREHVHRELAAYGAKFDPLDPSAMLSANTVEDAVCITGYAEAHRCSTYSIVTSEFHIPRCQFIFQCLAPTHNVEYIQAATPPDFLEAKDTHERLAMCRLAEQGGVIWQGILHQLTKPQ